MYRSCLFAAAFFFGLLIALGAEEKSKEKLPEIDDAKIVMIIAPDRFRDEELLIPRKIFKKQDADVTVASSTTKEVRGMLGEVVEPDIHYSKIKVKEYEAVVFVGGIGAKAYFEDETAHDIARAALDEGKILGAICLAPGILARAGVLAGKKATVYESEAKTLEKHGADYTGNSVEVDGDIITADGPKASEEFAREIVKAIARKRKEKKDKE